MKKPLSADRVPIIENTDVSSVLDTENDESVLEKKNTYAFRFGTSIFILVIFMAIAIYALSFVDNPPKQATSSVFVSPSPVASPSPSFDRSIITIEVLNGSRIAGVASREGRRLERLGYRVVSVGNTEKETTGNTLHLRANVRIHEKAILDDFSKYFSLTSVSGELTDGTASARFIIGK